MTPPNAREQFLAMMDRIILCGPPDDPQPPEDIAAMLAVSADPAPLPYLYCEQLRIDCDSTYAGAISALVARGVRLADATPAAEPTAKPTRVPRRIVGTVERVPPRVDPDAATVEDY